MLTNLAVLAEDRQPIALVEAVGSPHTSAEWARDFLRNLIGTSTIPSKYLVLTALDNTYIWQNFSSGQNLEGPECTVPTPDLLGDFWTNFAGRNISTSSLEILLYTWLSQLTSQQHEHLPPAYVRTGLPAAVKDGIVVSSDD